ncbi:hypothetical protein Pmani_030405 [Petrolisthes manimaculis]|uniref:Uncharacterized protein n=1 Tax=Petrolisthes manimaculis TaxID=1843537 RepID=A0AAE1NXX9_9EUCA|nr:hypothetical protein Pmani_030405 [Petrolisthes manimaculis]
MSGSYRLEEETDEDDESKSSSKANELGLNNVGGVFVVLLAGMGLASVVAVCEFVWKSRKLATEEHPGSHWHWLSSPPQDGPSPSSSHKLQQQQQHHQQQQQQQQTDHDQHPPVMVTSRSSQQSLDRISRRSTVSLRAEACQDQQQQQQQQQQQSEANLQSPDLPFQLISSV